MGQADSITNKILTVFMAVILVATVGTAQPYVMQGMEELPEDHILKDEKIQELLTIMPELGPILEAQAMPNGNPGMGVGRSGAKLNLDETMTPLQKGLNQTKMIMEFGDNQTNPGNPNRSNMADKCMDRGMGMPGRDGDEEDKGKGLKKGQRKCSDIPNMTFGKPEMKPVMKNGNKIGFKMKSETTIEYDKPSQRFTNSTDWGKLSIPKPSDLKQTFNPENIGGSKSVVNTAFFPKSENNLDQDCKDFDGAHYSGITTNGTDGCYQDVAGPLKLRETLEADPNNLLGCIHIPSNTTLEGNNTDSLQDDCFDTNDNFRKTTLIEMIDEDGLDLVDDDLDGLINEDNSTGTFSGVNDDHDCIDIAINEHLRELDCFTDNTFTTLIQTLSFNNATSCVYTSSGTIISGNNTDGIEDFCFDETNVLKTSINELFDEDGPEEIDNDNDGLTNEDPPSDSIAGSCKDIGMQIAGVPGIVMNNGTDTEECDLTMVVASKINKMKMNMGASKTPILLTDVDGDGIGDDVDNCPMISNLGQEDIDFDGIGDACDDDKNDPNTDPDLDGIFGIDNSTGTPIPVDNCPLVSNTNQTDSDKPMGDGVGDACDYTDSKEFGKEPRMIGIKETFSVECPGNAKLNDDGECEFLPRGNSGSQNAQISEVSTLSSGGPTSFVQSNFEIPDVSCQTNSGFDTCTDEVLMGFTFQPHSEWLFEFDINIFGFTIFGIVFGYSFSFNFGLRLPLRITVEQLPRPKILAGKQINLNTSVTPLDFSKQEYIDFCLEHQLWREPFIGANNPALAQADCERFSHPNMFNVFGVGVDDGDEFVFNWDVFAGAKVTIFEIDILTIGIDSQADIVPLCTIAKLHATTSILNLLLDSGVDAVNPNFLENVKNNLADCGSFTTPFGTKPIDHIITTSPFREFPIGITFVIPGFCGTPEQGFPKSDGHTPQDILKKVLAVGAGSIKLPICSGLFIGPPGTGPAIAADIKFKPRLGSNKITGVYNAENDGCIPGGACHRDIPIVWTDSYPLGNQKTALLPITVDNYDDTDHEDFANVNFDDVTLFFNILQIELFMDIVFAGAIIEWLPAIATISLGTLTVQLPDEASIQVGQHAGTEPATFPVFVENYGLQIHAIPENQTIATEDTPLQIKPGEFGNYTVNVRNIGSVNGTFDNFRVSFSNQPDQTGPLTFIVNPNNDFDCSANRDTNEPRFRGNPYDGLPDGCYDASGTLRLNVTEFKDEDPIEDPVPNGSVPADLDNDNDYPKFFNEDPLDDWASNPNATSLENHQIFDIDPYTFSDPTQPLVLGISPFKHPTTAPGIYAFKVEADSVEAKTFGLNPQDPSPNQNFRINATDVAFINVTAFYDPQIFLTPNPNPLQPEEPLPTPKPGVTVDFEVFVVNMANVNDTISVDTKFVDYNDAECTLTTLGRIGNDTIPNCPYRAYPTIIQGTPDVSGALDWTDGSLLRLQNGTEQKLFGSFEPFGFGVDGFTITAPSDWAGIDDTTYQYMMTSTSEEDPDKPPAFNSLTGNLNIEATKESNVRYIGLELAELIQKMEIEKEKGTPIKGTLPLTVHAMQQTNNRTLDIILTGNLDRADKQLAANIQMTQGLKQILKGLVCPGPPNCEIFEDWDKSADAIINDLTDAIANDKASHSSVLANAETLSSDAAYLFGGFTMPPPYTMYDKGKTIPIKVSILNFDYKPDNNATVAVFWIDSDNPGTEIPGKTKDPNHDNTAQFKQGMYQFNMSTDEMDAMQIVTIKIHIDDGTFATLKVLIK